LPLLLGVTTKASVEVEPDCSAGMVQTAVVPLGALQVPEPAVALLSVIPAEIVPVTVILVAGSGPWLKTVKVTVT
jgi:hypothetical protein